MPIADELSRIIAAKAAIRTSIIAKGVSVPAGDPIENYAAYIDAITGGSPTAPSAFTAGMWTLTGGDAQATIDITSLPANGGSAITSLQYRIDGGSAVTLSGTGTGPRTVTGLTNGTAYAFELRAVNAIGSGAWGDTKNVTPAAAGITYIEFATLSNMTAGGAAGATRTYTGSASDGTAGGPDWNLPIATAGGLQVATTIGGSTPLCGLYTTTSGAWDSNFLIIAYPSSGNWVVNGPGFSDLVTTARTYTDGDHVRVGYSDTGNTYTVQIARAADPATWLTLGAGTQARSGTLYPRLTSFGAAGAVFTGPRAF